MSEKPSKKPKLDGAAALEDSDNLPSLGGIDQVEF
jgi:hypothetical protein